MIKNKFGINLLFIIFIIFIVYSSVNLKLSKSIDKEDENKIYNVKKEFEIENIDEELIDNPDVYLNSDDSKIYDIYITILPKKDDTTITFSELNAYNEKGITSYNLDSNDPYSLVYFSEAPIDLNNLKTPNATIELRGQSSRSFQQKSYKIKIIEKDLNWYGYKNLNFNKHFEDDTRVKNKLSYDFFEKLDDFISLDTRFVNLYIMDIGNGEITYSNYGLFTFIEQPNKSFLKRHKLDANGNLYKAEFFEFRRYPDNLKTIDDITYDNYKFEEILESKGNNDHYKLLDMLDTLNDYSVDIDYIIDKYFDEDNLLTWLAVNILTENIDSNSRNYIIYSPLNSLKWYFIPWDYDKAWDHNYDKNLELNYEKWSVGISNYWGVIIFNRYFKAEGKVELLGKKIEEVSKLFNKSNATNLLNGYFSIVSERIFKEPDILEIDQTKEEYINEYYGLADRFDKAKKRYYETLDNPMPFFLHEAIKRNNKYNFKWDYSYDLQGDNVTYKFYLSSDENFSNIIFEYDNLINTQCMVDDLPPGEYYWNVISVDENGNTQIPFDILIKNGYYYFGVKNFVVN